MKKCFERHKGAVTTRACFEEDDVARITALVDGKRAGSLELYGDDGGLVVGTIEVSDKHRRRGIGTALYEAAVELGCRARLPVMSDSMRSPFAEAFWRKQHAKGRAVCRGDGGSVFWEPSYRALPDEVKARLPKPQVYEGAEQWPCTRFVISAPCATRSLEGLKKRRKPPVASRKRAR